MHMKTKNLSKPACLVVFFAVAICLFGCAKKEEKIDIAMIMTEKSRLHDGTFNQSTYEGIEKYAKSNNLKYKAYPPESKAVEDYLKAIEEAYSAGSEILVAPGFDFSVSIFIAQDLYPDIHFIVIDAIPHNGKFDETYEEKIAPNTYVVLFAEEQAGFLAGYAIVKDGFRTLGFFGGREFPAVVKYGYGFVQGAEFAAKELGLGQGEVTIKYDYAGNFDSTPENQSKAASWYNEGVEVIFACGGALGYSVMRAAESMPGKWVIGVDMDQGGDSETVITSALKMLANAVGLAIESHYGGTFPGGQSRSLGADENGIGMVMDNAKFKNFTQADYDKIYQMLVKNQDGITSAIINDVSVKATDLPCQYVVLK